MSYSIYALSDPNTGIVHYVGISRNTQRRYREHCRCSGLNLQKNTWIQQLLQQNQQPTLSIIEGGLSHDIAREREKVWIHHYLDLGLPLTNWNENEQARDGGIRIDDPELENLAINQIVHSKRIKKARGLIREWSKGKHKGWLGIAPSYLCAELEINRDEAAAILKDLEEEGFIHDNGSGNHFRLPDGRTYATRYYMTGERPDFWMHGLDDHLLEARLEP